MKKIKYVIITGCSTGIGYETAKYLKEKKFKVIVSCRKNKDVKRLSKNFKFDDIQNKYENDDDDMNIHSKLKSSLLQELSKTCMLLGVAEQRQHEDLTRALICEQFETNLFGHIELINLFIPHMRKQNEGRIIFNSSVLGLVSLPFSSAYNATKFAMEAFARSLRLELNRTNIKVSLIEPGPIEANFNINALKNLKRIKINNSVYKNKYYKMMKYLVNGRDFFSNR
jgi:short-subunit dehydrogenase